MNYDLAIMALEGLARMPLTITSQDGQVVITGEPSAFKELARLCLLIGGGESEDAFELQPGVHLSATSPMLTLQPR